MVNMDLNKISKMDNACRSRTRDVSPSMLKAKELLLNMPTEMSLIEDRIYNSRVMNG